MTLSIVTKLRDILTANIAESERQLKALDHTLIAHNTVLSMGHGNYLRRVFDDGAATFTMRIANVTKCSRWERDAAERMANGAGIIDGNGTTPTPVSLRSALAEEIARDKALLVGIDRMDAQTETEGTTDA